MVKTSWGQPLGPAFIAGLLYIVESAHAEAEKRLPPHDWQRWYAAYIAARINGDSFGECVVIADRAVLQWVDHERAQQAIFTPQTVEQRAAIMRKDGVPEPIATNLARDSLDPAITGRPIE